MYVNINLIHILVHNHPSGTHFIFFKCMNQNKQSVASMFPGTGHEMPDAMSAASFEAKIETKLQVGKKTPDNTVRW